MSVYKNISELPHFLRPVLTIGTFDGVHLGHRQIISQVVQEARSIDGTAILVTFYPHPKMVVSNGKNPLFVLNTPDEKYKLLKEAGIDSIVEVPFTETFSEQNAESYIRDFLVGLFNPSTIIIGYDHRFGKNRTGDYQLLESQSLQYGFVVKEIPEHILRNITISSTRIRNAIQHGEILEANELLGYNYFFSGIVVKGNQLGRTIGFPTANIVLNDQQKLIPCDGVYAVTLEIEGLFKQYFGMMNIGTRPTVDGKNRVIEVNIFNFTDEIYGLQVTVTVWDRLRDEIKFSGLDALKLQLGKDKESALLKLNIR